MRIKTKIQNKLYIWLKSKIEKKNQFSKRIQKKYQKNENQDWYKNKNKFLIKEWNWKENSFNKRGKKNQKNEDQIDKNNIL
jgi:hypothetical protein